MNLNAPPDARVICTIGMHRSGTSLVARMVNLLGVQLGPDPRVVTAGDDNPKGYWEYRPFVDINDAILDRFGGRWDQPPALPPSWASDPRLDDLRSHARDLIAKDFSATPLWGWKDPRACLTLPFWQDVIGPMRYVICLRNPCAVAASLTHRDGRRRENAEWLWLAHMQAALADTSGQPRLFVSYEDLLEDWRPDLRRMAAFIGHPERAEDPRVHEAVAAFLEQEMCHHHPSMEDLARDERMSFQTLGLAFALRGYARPLETPFNDAIGPDADATIPERAGQSLHRALDLLAARAIEAWDQPDAVTAGAPDAAHETPLASSDAQPARLHSRASLVSALHTTTVERDVRTREYQAAMQALDEIHASCSWRLVIFARGIIVDLLPAGTRRRRAFHAVLSRVTKRLTSTRRRRVVDLPVA